MLFTFQSTCYIIELENKERNDTMSKFEVNDIVKCMCNEEMEQSLIEGEYYVVTETYSTASGQTNIKVALLGSDILDGICYRGIRFDKADPTNKEDVQAIVDKQISEDNPHCEIAESFIEEAHNIIVDRLYEASQNTSSISHNLSQVLNLALSNTSEEEVLNNLYSLLPLSEIKLGARYKHIITGKKYYLIQDMNHNYHTEANCYLLVDADTHKTVEPMQEGEYSMRLLIRNMGLQLEE